MPFKDVENGEFYTTAVLWAAENGITIGYGVSDIFAPDIICTRGQIITMLNRYLGGKATSTEIPSLMWQKIPSITMQFCGPQRMVLPMVMVILILLHPILLVLVHRLSPSCTAPCISIDKFFTYL